MTCIQKKMFLSKNVIKENTGCVKENGWILSATDLCVTEQWHTACLQHLCCFDLGSTVQSKTLQVEFRESCQLDWEIPCVPEDTDIYIPVLSFWLDFKTSTHTITRMILVPWPTLLSLPSQHPDIRQNLSLDNDFGATAAMFWKHCMHSVCTNWHLKSNRSGN